MQLFLNRLTSKLMVLAYQAEAVVQDLASHPSESSDPLAP